jgi:hypothetical protein
MNNNIINYINDCNFKKEYIQIYHLNDIWFYSSLNEIFYNSITLSRIWTLINLRYSPNKIYMI